MRLGLIIIIIMMCLYCSSDENTYLMLQEKGFKSSDEYNRTQKNKKISKVKKYAYLYTQNHDSSYLRAVV